MQLPSGDLSKIPSMSRHRTYSAALFSIDVYETAGNLIPVKFLSPR